MPMNSGLLAQTRVDRAGTPSEARLDCLTISPASELLSLLLTNFVLSAGSLLVGRGRESLGDSHSPVSFQNAALVSRGRPGGPAITLRRRLLSSQKFREH